MISVWSKRKPERAGGHGRTSPLTHSGVRTLVETSSGGALLVRFRQGKLLTIRCTSAQHHSADFPNVALTEFVVADEETHVDGAVKNIEHQIKVQVVGQFATLDTPSQSLVGLLPSR